MPAFPHGYYAERTLIDAKEALMPRFTDDLMSHVWPPQREFISAQMFLNKFRWIDVVRRRLSRPPRRCCTFRETSPSRGPFKLPFQTCLPSDARSSEATLRASDDSLIVRTSSFISLAKAAPVVLWRTAASLPPATGAATSVPGERTASLATTGERNRHTAGFHRCNLLTRGTWLRRFSLTELSLKPAKHRVALWSGACASRPP